ncbi:MAG: hypothetical protein SCALA702_01420 [Melioribacteraceae bacterium]|nr:MAG: hypothetical protein SCALA702_01420 [Melioribacteraceae bacterium]
MSERTINLSFPIKENILLSVKESKEQFLNEMLYSAALAFYRRRKLSLGQAAEFAGFTKPEFIEKLKKENEHIFDFSEEEIDEIFADVKR